MRARGAAASRLHLDYIERDGVEEDGSPGKLYAKGSDVIRDRLAAEIGDEQHQFRFIVSPEDGAQLDLTEFTRALMAQVERDVGRRLVWGAVNHHDTDNPHVHIVVRGVDVAGAPVRIERAYIAERMRWQAQHLVTRELGQRTELDVSRQLNREVRQERFTSLDRRLAQVMTGEREVDLRRLALTLDRAARGRFVARLETLGQLRLASKTTGARWQLSEGWEDALRALGERGDIIKRLHAALGRPPVAGQFSVSEAATDGPIEGVVRRKGLHDELTGQLYAVIETARGRAHYVRVEPGQAEAFREGQVVRFETERERWAKRMDGALLAAARHNGGVYDAARHRQQLADRPVQAGGGSVSPEAVVAANQRRLQRLERYRIVSPLGDGRWGVPANLLEVLAERERSHPRFRSTVTVLGDGLASDARQLRPTWLDRQQVPERVRSGYGFGAEVGAAAKERSRFLTRMGVGVGARDVLADLEDRARLNLGRVLSQASGATFEAEPAGGFRGRALPCPPSVGGAERYVQIVDEPNRRLALVPADAAAGLEGQVVELDRDTAGHIVARRAGMKRGV